MTERIVAKPGYEGLAEVLDQALIQAQSGKGAERHARPAQSFVDQLIVVLSMELGSNHGDIFQACKKALESVRLEPEAGIAELLGAINYLAAAVIVRRKLAGPVPVAPAPAPSLEDLYRKLLIDTLSEFEWFSTLDSCTTAERVTHVIRVKGTIADAKSELGASISRYILDCDDIYWAVI